MNAYKREVLWQALNQIAPLQLAGSWDNVGPLLESVPHPSLTKIQDEKILLTIDLTESVFEEALAGGYTCIVTYHPIIFGGLKRLTLDHSQSRTLLRAAQAGIAIYSPHTALDAVSGGVCDWLVACSLSEQKPSYPFEFKQDFVTYTPIEPDLNDATQGAGRVCQLNIPISIAELCRNLEKNLSRSLSQIQQKPYLRLALSSQVNIEQKVSKIAFCPGAGGSLFKPLNDVDLLITGEMSHHDLLARTQSGTSVILTEHSRCERGYLQSYQSLIMKSLAVQVGIAQSDDDPLQLFTPLLV